MYLERTSHHPADPVALLPVHPVPVHLRGRDRARRTAAPWCTTASSPAAPCIAFLLLPRPVLRADPAALAGVRPVAAGAGVDDEDQRAHAHAEVSTPDPEHPVEPGRVAGAIQLRRRAVRLPEAPASRALHGVDLTIAPGRDGGAGRRDRRGQVDDREAGGPLLRRRPTVRCSSTACRSPTSTSRAYRRRLGYVPQEPFLFSGTIRDNIAYGRPEAHRRRSRAGGTRSRRARVHRRAPRRLPAPGHRARALAVGRAAPAHLPRARRCSSTPRSSCSTRPPPTSTSAPRRGCSGRWASSRSGRTTLLIAHRLQTARTRRPDRRGRRRPDRRAGQPRRAAGARGAVPSVEPTAVARACIGRVRRVSGVSPQPCRHAVDLARRRRRGPRSRGSSSSSPARASCRRRRSARSRRAGAGASRRVSWTSS